MQRLTTDKPVYKMTNIELAHNCCISENGHAVYRDFEKPIDARKLVLNLLDYYGVEGFTIQNDEDLDEFMLDSLMDGPFTNSGLIALLYRFIWSMAEMRARLKEYEDTGLTPEQLYKMDKLYSEKCRELAEIRRNNSQKAVETMKKVCEECDENQVGGWCGNCRYDEFIKALSIDESKVIVVGSVLWEMHGKKRNREIKWYPVPKCVEEITEHMYLFGDGCGISHNGVGHNMFLSRRECLDNFLKSHDALVTKSDYGEDIPDNCYELPRTDWQDYEVCKFDGVSATSVYMNGLNQLLDVSRQISWRKESCEYRGDIEVLTLTEIYEQLAKEGRSPMITVFVNDPMKCDVFQCGNYEDGKWVHLGKVHGYA